jgi:hypothetical protein
MFSDSDFKQPEGATRHPRGAFAPELRINIALDIEEGAQGMPGDGLAHGPPASKKRRRQSPQGSAKSSGIPRATVLTVSFVLSPGNRAFLPPSSRGS